MDFSKIKPDFRSEIIRGGELQLHGQLKLATSADLRASSLSGMFVAITTGLLAAVVALANSANVSGFQVRFPYSLVLVQRHYCQLAWKFGRSHKPASLPSNH